MAGSLSEGLPLGLVELDADGTVLYYNRDSRDELKGFAPQLVGRNLFDEVSPAALGEQLRLLVGHFLGGHSPSQSRLMTLARDGVNTNFRVMFARIRTSPSQQGRESVLLHIREDFSPPDGDGQS